MIVHALRSRYVGRGEFFSANELFEQGRLGVKDKLIFGPVVQLADEIRRRWGRPLRCSSGVRSVEKQQDLARRGFKTAKYSPHVIGRCALDLDVSTAAEVRELVQIVREVSEALKIPVRIGWKQYLQNGQTFVHIDTAPLLAAAAFKEGLINQYTFHAWKRNGTEW